MLEMTLSKNSIENFSAFLVLKQTKMNSLGMSVGAGG
jgi:hypothetical protein